MNFWKLFGRAPHNGTDTSIAASEQIVERAGTDAERIYNILIKTPMTCEEIEQATGLRHQTASARIRGLAIQGRVRDSGVRRKTVTGRAASVWMTSGVAA